MKTDSKATSRTKTAPRNESNRRRLEKTLREMLDLKREFAFLPESARIPYRRIIE